jgi:hypothetical protein
VHQTASKWDSELEVMWVLQMVAKMESEWEYMLED